MVSLNKEKYSISGQEWYHVQGWYPGQRLYLGQGCRLEQGNYFGQEQLSLDKGSIPDTKGILDKEGILA